MTLVVDTFKTLLPSKSKLTPSGWTSFNAPCCVHKGHRADTRKRGGVRFDNNGIIYHCFNCKYASSWQPGSQIPEKLKNLARWLHASDDTINQLILESLKTEGIDTGINIVSTAPVTQFPEKPLPAGSLLLSEWAMKIDSLSPNLNSLFINVLEYLISRGYQNPLDYNFYWNTDSSFKDRVIIPFTWQGKNVGFTARKIKPSKLKYLSDQPTHFVFNTDAQRENQQYVLVTEGPFDALAVNGVGLLTNGITDKQAEIINTLGKEVILIPDQDFAGLELYKRAIELNWSIAVPTWADEIKDAADAVTQYGKIFVVVDAISTAQKGSVKITLAKHKLEYKLERLK